MPTSLVDTLVTCDREIVEVEEAEKEERERETMENWTLLSWTIYLIAMMSCGSFVRTS